MSELTLFNPCPHPGLWYTVLMPSLEAGLSCRKAALSWDNIVPPSQESMRCVFPFVVSFQS